jgi:hypothetical protein
LHAGGHLREGGPKYAFIALVDAADEKGDEAWGGLGL